jgi:hypothetical protein
VSSHNRVSGGHGRGGGHAVAFGEEDEADAHHFGAGNAFLDPVAHHERGDWSGPLAFEDAFCTGTCTAVVT